MKESLKEMKELLKEMKEYIERVVYQLDGFGDMRSLEEIIEDGEMPKLYWKICKELEKLDESKSQNE